MLDDAVLVFPYPRECGVLADLHGARNLCALWGQTLSMFNFGKREANKYHHEDHHRHEHRHRCHHSLVLAVCLLLLALVFVSESMIQHS